EFCTYTEEDRFFSYRRAKVSGRMASGILMRG
ncbi:MAG: laccase domain-containing protein, partial [Gammaproteobacteria bacterium]